MPLKRQNISQNSFDYFGYYSKVMKSFLEAELPIITLLAFFSSTKRQ